MAVDIVQLHLMTFSDNLQHISILFICSLSFGCWAPEVEPPAPKLSPAEITGISIATASASSLGTDSMRHIPSQQALVDPTQRKTLEQDPVPSAELQAPVENLQVFPYQATIQGDSVPLLGHGGGTILLLTSDTIKSAAIEVLEEQNGKARVLCRGCSPSHPYQAGWISMDYIQSNN